MAKAIKFVVFAVVILLGLGALFIVGVDLWGAHYEQSTINKAVAEIAARSGWPRDLLRGLVTLASIPYFYALGKFLFDWKQQTSLNPFGKFQNKWGLIVVTYTGLYPITLYVAGLGAVAGHNYCAYVPGGELRTYADPINDPVYGTPSHLCTTEDAKALEEQRHHLAPASQISIADPLRFAFFDNITGLPKVWFATDDDSTYRFYDKPGNDPVTGQQLLPITTEAVQALRSKHRHETVIRERGAQVAEQISQSQQYVSNARIAFANKDYAAAIESCKQALATGKSPECSEMKHDAGIEQAHQLVRDGQSEIERAEFDAAYRDGKRALALDPSNTHAAELIKTALALKNSKVATY